MSEIIKRKVFLISLLLTLLVFLIGIIANYILDSFRYSEIEKEIENYEIDTTAYYLEREFVGAIGQDKCAVMTKRFFDLKEEVHDVGQALTKYKHRTFFAKVDFDYLKRHYFLLELKFYVLINKLNEECDSNYANLLFFYEIDDEDSITQGYVLDDLSQSYTDNVVVLSVDKDYEDEPLVRLVVNKFNVTTAPVTILNSNIRFEGLHYGGVINASLKEEIKKSDTDKFAKIYNFNYFFDNLFDNIGMDKNDYILNLKKQLNSTMPPFAKGDILFVLGRLTNNYSLECEALQHFDNAVSDNGELNAIIYETIASIGCGRNKKAFLELASDSWMKAGNAQRSKLDSNLANNLNFDIRFETSVPSSYFSQSFFPEKLNSIINSITLGKSKLILKTGDIIASQTDRVMRDWLSYQINQSPYSGKILSVFSEKTNYDKNADASEAAKELLPEIGWHEGGRIKELVGYGIKNIAISGTVVAKKDGKWYAPNEKGIFMFEVPFDKIMYPTTRFLRKDLAVVIDTHGMNMLVEQAVRNKQKNNIKAVIACCDHPGKIKAALYLSEQGITPVCLTDKYSYLALGHNSNIITSPPIRLEGGDIIIGDQPLTIPLNEKIIVMNSTDTPYGLWYYQTPANYFAEIEKHVNNLTSMDIVYVTLGGFNNTKMLIDEAEKEHASVLAARVFNSNDYNTLKEWLIKSHDNKAILFHSASYPHGYKLLKEFPEQVTFGDVNPVFNSDVIEFSFE